MRNRTNVFASLLLVLTFAACTNKPPSTAENQPAGTSNQQAGATSPPPQAQQQSQPQPQQQPQPQPPQPEASASTPAPAPPVTAVAPPPPPAPPKPVVIPADTALTVQVDQAISTRTAKEGDVFTATVSSPVIMHGKPVIPRGARARGVVLQSKSPGRFKGEGALSVKLTEVTVRGASYPIETSANTSTEKSKGKRSAVIIGGGGGGGALLGGIAGGGKGAAIGALLGAGAGTAGAGLTGNKELAIPAETALTFRLHHPLTLKPRGTKTDESAGTDTAPSSPESAPALTPR